MGLLALRHRTTAPSVLTDVEDGNGQLDVSEMAGTRGDVLFAGRAVEHAVNSAQLGVIQALLSGVQILFVLRALLAVYRQIGTGATHHRLWIDDVHHAHPLDFLG